MVIEIIQKYRSQGFYEIFVNGEMYYTSYTDPNVYYSDVRLFDLTGNCISMLKNDSSTFRTHYEIRLNNGEMITYKSVSWRNHFQCSYYDDVYDVYGHLGYKYSIFKNNSQIGWWNNLAAFDYERDRIRIIANNDCKYELLIIFCLANSNQARQFWGSNALAIDLGNIIPCKKRFNYNWRPS